MHIWNQDSSKRVEWYKSDIFRTFFRFFYSFQMFVLFGLFEDVQSRFFVIGLWLLDSRFINFVYIKQVRFYLF